MAHPHQQHQCNSQPSVTPQPPYTPQSYQPATPLAHMTHSSPPYPSHLTPNPPPFLHSPSYPPAPHLPYVPAQYSPSSAPLPGGSPHLPALAGLLPKPVVPKLICNDLSRDKVERNRAVEDWLWQVDSALASAPSDPVKIHLAAGFCVDPSGPLMKLETFRRLGTWPEFVHAIKQRYKERITEEEAYRYLSNLRRDPNVTVKAFGTVVLSRVSDLRQELGYDTAAVESLAKQLFCRSLPPTIGPFIATEGLHMSFDRLLEHASWFCDVEQTASRVSTQPTPYVNAIADPATVQVDKGPGDFPRPQTITKRGTGPPPRRVHTYNITCYNCGGRGHMQRACPSGVFEA
nr:uncharacterized protein LOC123749438 [Procambarus clarkii]